MTTIRTRGRLLAAVLTAVLSAGVVAATSVGAAPARGDAECPLNALERADGPVEIVFWHSMRRALEETLVALTDEFNSSQNDVRVSLVNQVDYDDTQQKFRAGLSTGQLPDIVQFSENMLQQAIDSQAILPAQACIDADGYDTSDFLPRVIDYYTVDGTQWAMPFNTSNPVLYYDKNAFLEAGLDPDDPPATLEEVREYSEQIKANLGYPFGFALKIDAWFFEQWLAKDNRFYVDNGNGRKDRASEVLFDAKVGQQVFDWMSGMVADDLASTNPRLGQGELNNYLALGNRQAAMTIDTTAALGEISQVLAAGDYAHVDLGVAPLPGSTKGGVTVGGGALYIVSQSSPEKQAAAWEYTKFLNEPEQVAAWAAGTGYIPTRESAVELPAVQQRWAELPGFQVAYDQLLDGKNNLKTAGPVIGAFQAVRQVIEEQQTAMLNAGKSSKAALRDAEQQSNDAIADYNSRIG
ncbi:MAG TPA: ABC transporter substrate-binding protein [Acidimicrobiia bacterium]